MNAEELVDAVVHGISTERHVAVLRVNAELMVQIFTRDDRKEPDKLCWMAGMPADAKIIGATYDAAHDWVEFVVESPEFKAVRSGHEPERIMLSAGWQKAVTATNYGPAAGEVSHERVPMWYFHPIPLRAKTHTIDIAPVEACELSSCTLAEMAAKLPTPDESVKLTPEQSVKFREFL